MRRTVFICASLIALAVPLAAVASSHAVGDGTLVVKNATGTLGTPVVTLVIHGAAIGRITGSGRIVIADLNPVDVFAPEVTGAISHKDDGDSIQKWGSAGDLRFRAVGGSYRITIYGSGVNLVASGSGWTTLAGSADLPDDGSYSLNGKDFQSLPATPTKQLPVGVPTSTIG